MSSNVTNDPLPDLSTVKADSDSIKEETPLISSESIKIFLFPPNNKRFRFDEQTQKIEIETVNPDNSASTLTPLIENCKMLDSAPSSEIISSSNHSVTTELNIKEILQIKNVFDNSVLGDECFLKGCKWSDDGLCLLSNSEDNVMRLFEINENVLKENDTEVQPVLSMKEGGTIYDFVWYPKMNSLDPVTCVFACTSQNSPIHLWDAYTGQLRATYQPINQYDEVTSAYSLTFSPDGFKLYSGFKKCIRIFDTGLPGKVSDERNLKNKENPYQSNIISSICINPAIQSLYALGSYDKTIGLYTEPEGELLCILKGHNGGITQIIFSSDGNYLYSGARKDNEILCWDIRNPGKVIFSMERLVDTQQKLLFDLSLDEKYLITGTTDSYIKIFNLKTQTEKILQPLQSFKAHLDCVNGVQYHPKTCVFASASGQRHPLHMSKEFENEDSDENSDSIENSIKIWSYSEPIQKLIDVM